mmetsp:Transcript_5404/g.11744  ORF Transcript_5404/g.11744 Transcript_5404/m.11744 type:complete len:206 (-) Transcript_5404:157-774(-)
MLTPSFEKSPHGSQCIIERYHKTSPNTPILLACLLTLPHALANLLFEPRPVVTPLYRCVQVRRTLVVGVRQQGDHRHQNLLHPEDGPPPFLGRLVEVVRVLPRMVQDGDADLPVLVNVRVPHLALEGHFGRFIREIFGENEAGLEEATLEEGAVRSHDEDLPVVDVALVGEPHGHEIDRVFGQLMELSLEKFRSVVRHCAWPILR